MAVVLVDNVWLAILNIITSLVIGFPFKSVKVAIIWLFESASLRVNFTSLFPVTFKIPFTVAFLYIISPGYVAIITYSPIFGSVIVISISPFFNGKLYDLVLILNVMFPVASLGSFTIIVAFFSSCVIFFIIRLISGVNLSTIILIVVLVFL